MFRARDSHNYVLKPCGLIDHHARGGFEGEPELEAVLHPAQIIDTVRAGTGHRQFTKGRTGGQQQLVVIDRAAGSAANVVRGRIDRCHACVGSEFNVVFGIPLLGVAVDFLLFGSALQ